MSISWLQQYYYYSVKKISWINVKTPFKHWGEWTIVATLKAVGIRLGKSLIGSIRCQERIFLGGRYCKTTNVIWCLTIALAGDHLPVHVHIVVFRNSQEELKIWKNMMEH